MKTVYVVTLWSGGKAGKNWKSLEKPEMLPKGTGVVFRSIETGLNVEVIGNISIEEYEHGTESLYEAEGPSAETDDAG